MTSVDTATSLIDFPSGLADPEAVVDTIVTPSEQISSILAFGASSWGEAPWHRPALAVAALSLAGLAIWSCAKGVSRTTDKPESTFEVSQWDKRFRSSPPPDDMTKTPFKSVYDDSSLLLARAKDRADSLIQSWNLASTPIAQEEWLGSQQKLSVGALREISKDSSVTNKADLLTDLATYSFIMCGAENPEEGSETVTDWLTDAGCGHLTSDIFSRQLALDVYRYLSEVYTDMHFAGHRLDGRNNEDQRAE